MKHLLLLLDDEPNSTMTFERLAKSARHELITASSPARARTLLERFLPHALIVDIHLGGSVSGLEWLSTLSGTQFSGLPSIILTSSSSPRDVARALDLNVVDYIIKPSNSLLITQKIEHLSKAIDRSNVYSCSFKQGLTATLRVPGTIAWVNELGISVEGPFQVSSAKTRVEIGYDTTWFAEMGLSDPKLQFVAAEQVTTRHHLNQFLFDGWTDKQRDGLWRWLFGAGYRPSSRNESVDISLRRTPIWFEEHVELPKINESNLEVITRTFAEVNSIADLRIDDLEVPILLKENQTRTDGSTRVRARIDPRIRIESAIDLRRMIIRLKDGQSQK